jgi:hypothetical protein
LRDAGLGGGGRNVTCNYSIAIVATKSVLYNGKRSIDLKIQVVGIFY